MSLLALALGTVNALPMIAENDGPVIEVGTGTVTTGPVTISVSGGTAPYTYFASYSSGDPCTIVGASTDRPAFQRAGVSGLDQFQGVVRVLVTDNRNRIAETFVTWQIVGGYA